MKWISVKDRLPEYDRFVIGQTYETGEELFVCLKKGINVQDYWQEEKSCREYYLDLIDEWRLE